MGFTDPLVWPCTSQLKHNETYLARKKIDVSLSFVTWSCWGTLYLFLLSQVYIINSHPLPNAEMHGIIHTKRAMTGLSQPHGHNINTKWELSLRGPVVIGGVYSLVAENSNVWILVLWPISCNLDLSNLLFSYALKVRWEDGTRSSVGLKTESA